ncbi:MAG: maltose alpha-D-glucosyltransferase, partial [Bacillota bacterium]
MAARYVEPVTFADDPLWYKDAVIYEVHVRAFYDSNADGIGDFPGLTQKLDYIQSLGVTAVWLLPFYPSPLKDDGYDIADYFGVHPAYGTLRDFEVFLREAHRRGIRVITELVLNHTSDQHPWFQRSRRAKPGSVWRNFYVWSDTPDRYREARIIFKDFEPSNWTWDPVARAYYWRRFYSHQPDLNYDNPYVRKMMFRVVDHWMRLGVDGMRLDAIPYLYEREGTPCESLPETFELIKQLRRHIDSRYPNRMLLGEANQWPEDAVAYFGSGDACHMVFHFPLMPRLFMAIHMEDRFPITDILSQTPAIPETAQWALFLRNHDELTLEMVTDEERDYMYRVYAQDPQARINLGIRRRLAPLLGNHRRKIELMNGLLFSLPGTPIIYYGDEIGMGDNIYLGDRNGVRTPMQWSADRNAGFSRANPQRLYLPIIIDPEYHYEAVNVEAQQNNPHSLLWWMRRLIALRKRFKAFSRGSLDFLHPENRKVLAFVRRYEDEQILVVANLSRFVQYVELDLSAFRGMVPVELFGRTEFPPVGDGPYFLTLGPHAFYWFSLERKRQPEIRAGEPAVSAAELPRLEVRGAWESVIGGRAREALEGALATYLRVRRWFGNRRRRIQSVSLLDAVPLSNGGNAGVLVLARVDYTEGDPDTYLVPLTFAAGQAAIDALARFPHAVVARLTVVSNGGVQEGVLHDALWDPGFCKRLLDAIVRRRRLKGMEGEVLFWPARAGRQLVGTEPAALEPSVLQVEQRNTSVLFGDRLILKLFRCLGDGVNPELETLRFLTERTSFENIPPLVGGVEYRRGQGEPLTLALLEGFVPHGGQDAWDYTLDALHRYFEGLLTGHSEAPAPDPPSGHLLDLAARVLPALAVETIGPYLEAARLLGQRTAELHLALASAPGDPAFAPEPFSANDQRSLYQAARRLTSEVVQELRRRMGELDAEARQAAQAVLELEPVMMARLRSVLERKVDAVRIRCHGDYHLGQLLFTGKDFVVIDFEGDPARPVSARRLKRSPLQDVAGMFRSFDRAAHLALRAQVTMGVARPEDLPALERWARWWTAYVSAAFLGAYLRLAGEAPFMPREREIAGMLLDFFLLERALRELADDLGNRPDQVGVALQGIL